MHLGDRFQVFTAAVLVVGFGWSAHGQLTPGEPITGQPITGQPNAGQPNAGQVTPGQPIPGQPVLGQQGTETAAADNAKAAAALIVLDGYCTVSLLDGDAWRKGLPQVRVIYDSRSYLFAGEAEKAKFLSSPENYVPVLGGDCVYTFATTGKRIPSNINFSSLHKGRLYFFSSLEHKQAFLADAGKFENVDLALSGHCPVTKVSTGQDVAGNPQFSLYNGGMRYLFAGADQRLAFLNDPEKYLQPAAELPVAFKGFCPVSLRDESQWVKGKAEHTTTHDGKSYHFSSAQHQATFLASSRRYTPVLGGDCVVALVDGGKREAGSVFFATYYKDRLYMFVSAEAKLSFKSNPEKYAHADLAFGGNCPVSFAQSGVEVAGEATIESVHNGLRYRFLTPEHLQAFEKAPATFIQGLR